VIAGERLFVAGANTHNCLLEEDDGIVKPEFREIPLPFSQGSNGYLDVLFTGQETLVLSKCVLY